MKQTLYVVAVLLTAACSTSTTTNQEATTEQPVSQALFGDTITVDDALPAAEVLSQLQGHDSIRVKLVGTVAKVCQVKGCWMTMSVSENQGMHVSFKDYGFFVPKDISGKEAVIEGYAYVDTMSVDELRHYAEDAGKTEAEISAINAPETKLSFVADGVVVKDYSISQSAQQPR